MLLSAVELIVSVVALRKGMIKLVQTSLLGSILSNCLLVLGMSFMLGGMKHSVQIYNQKGAHMLSSLLLLASIALVLPAAFVNSFQPHPSMSHLLRISRVTALLLFVIYGLYLFFQLYTHSEMFSDENEEGDEEQEQQQQQQGQGQQQLPSATYATTVKKAFVQQPQSSARAADVPAGGVHTHGFQAASVAEDEESDEESEPVRAISDHMRELGDLEAPARGSNGTNGGQRRPQSIKEDDESNSAQHSNNGDADGGIDDEGDDEDEDDSDLPQFTLTSSILLLVAVTVAVAICSEFLVDSIEEVTQQWGMNVSFVGVILLPIVGNAAEHATAVTVAMKNKMDLSIGVAIGSSTQIALFLIPFVTLLGWIIDQPMSLNFSAFETISFLVAVLMVTTLLKNGESNWLQGVMLMSVYVIIATAFWYVPERGDNPKYQNHHTSWMPIDNANVQETRSQ